MGVFLWFLGVFQSSFAVDSYLFQALFQVILKLRHSSSLSLISTGLLTKGLIYIFYIEWHNKFIEWHNKFFAYIRGPVAQ